MRRCNYVLYEYGLTIQILLYGYNSAVIRTMTSFTIRSSSSLKFARLSFAAQHRLLHLAHVALRAAKVETPFAMCSPRLVHQWTNTELLVSKHKV